MTQKPLKWLTAASIVVAYLTFKLSFLPDADKTALHNAIAAQVDTFLSGIADHRRSAESGTTATVVVPVDKWSFEDTTDKLTGDTTSSLRREISLQQGGTAQMTADCRQLNLPLNKPFNFLSIRVDFFDRDDHPLNIDTSHFNENNVGTIRYSAEKGKEGKVDAALLYTNEVQLRVWIGFDMALLGNTQDPFGFANAPYFRVEVPLSDGESPVFDLLPQDKELHKAFVTSCGTDSSEQDTVEPATSEQSKLAATNQDDSSAATKPPTTPDFAPNATVNTVQLNLRTEPNARSDIVIKLDQGADVRVVRHVDSTWDEVDAKCENGSVCHGFANTRFLTPGPN